MLRIMLRLLGIKDFEVCQSCETLKQQLTFANAEKKELTNMLLNIIKPKEYEAPLIEMNQVATSSALFSRRRAALEAKDREEAKILKQSTNLGRPDFVTDDVTTKRLETELGIEEKKEA